MAAFSASPKSCVVPKWQGRATGHGHMTDTAPSRRAHQHQGLPPGCIPHLGRIDEPTYTVILDTWLPHRNIVNNTVVFPFQVFKNIDIYVAFCSETRKSLNYNENTDSMMILGHTKNQTRRCLGKWLEAVVCQEYFVVLCALRTCLEYGAIGACLRKARDQHQHSQHQHN